MSFVGYYQDYKNNVLKVSERVNGKRILQEYPLIFEYYVQDKDGYYEGYDGKKLKKISLSNNYQMKQHKEQCQKNNIKTYEMSFNIPNKVLYQYYNKQSAPILHKSFADIEVDRKGYEYLTVKQLVEKACCPINAISIYNDWQETLYTLMLCPETLNFEDAQAICNKFDNTFLFKDESQLLNGIIAILDDCDCFSGWNSTRFDTPYIVRRIENVLGKEYVKKLCLWGVEPKYKEKENVKFHTIDITYEIIGKWFTDYMELYMKHEQGKKESYKLNSIAEIELGEQKVQHTETLEDMYRYNYEDFIKYNRQDTMLVKKLDDKLKFIDIHNRQAHEATCSLETTMGTVQYMNQNIINALHNKGLIAPDKEEGINSEYDGIIPPGAFVPEPIVGLCTNVISFDLNSLYPSIIRSLNLSPETIVAQIKMNLTIPYLWNKIKEKKLWKKVSEQIPDWGAAWSGDDMWGCLEYQEVMKQSDTILTLQLNETGEEIDLPAKDIYEMIFSKDSHLSISGAGTIFRTDKVGIINEILTNWYAQRKKYKKEMAKFEDMAVGVKIDDEDLLNDLKNEV